MQYVSALELMRGENLGGHSEPVFSATWSLVYDTVGKVYAATSWQPCSSCYFPDVRGPVRLVFMKNSWSGIVDIVCDDVVEQLDLFSTDHEVVEHVISNALAKTIKIRIRGDRNPLSQASQVWFHGMWVESRQEWIPPYRPVTRTLDIVNGHFGTFMTIRNDVGISHSIREFGCWGLDQVRLFERIIRPGSNVLDIGANIGHHTVVMSKLVGKLGRVHAFEPQPFVHRVLQANLALNHCHNVDAYLFALGNENGVAKMKPLDYETIAWNVGGLGIFSGVQSDDNGQDVSILKIDDLPDLSRIEFVKCDAQGFDFEVLKGGKQLIGRDLPVILFEVAPVCLPTGPDSYRDLYDLLEAMGYMLLDPEDQAFRKPARIWGGGPEEWDVLAVQPHHFSRFGIG